MFERSDVRGKYPEEVNEPIVRNIGKALGTFAREHVIVGMDMRDSSPSLKDSIIEGITSSGCNVTDIGNCTTDMLAFAAKHFGAYGAMITASHLGLDKNGVKFFYPEGHAIYSNDLKRLKGIFRNKDFKVGGGSIKTVNFHPTYLKSIEKIVLPFVKKRHKILVDCCCGPSIDTTPSMLKMMGFDVSVTNEGGQLDRLPEPTKITLTKTAKKVVDGGFDLGIAHDPDGDRIAVITSQGNVIHSSELLKFFSTKIGGNRPVIATIDSLSTISELSDVVYSKIGDVYISEAIIQHDAHLAGEASGHFTYSPFIPSSTGTLFGCLSACFAEEINRLNTTVNEVKERIFVDDRDAEMSKITTIIKDHEDVKVLTDIDGIKFHYKNHQVLVRASGTESIIRINVEGDNCNDILEELVTLIG